jgi:hypothetical protein
MPSPDEQRRITADASTDTKLALNGLTRFMINPPDIQEPLGLSRAARVCLFFEASDTAPHLLNRFVNESRKKRELKNVNPQKGELKTSTNRK